MIAAYVLPLCGWGWAVRRALRMDRGPWPLAAVLGLSAVVFLGGILNLARLARPWALAIVAAAGVVFFFASLRGIPFRWAFLRNGRRAAMLLFAVAVAGFAAHTELPPRAYNFHDDYQKYFAHPVRMIETGTVYGSPLSAVGSETLGGQAFLQGFLVAALPVREINGFDAVVALFLCLVLAGELASGSRCWIAVAAMLAVVTIDPQSVNISAIYSAGALVMALAAIVSDPRALGHSALPNPVAVGLLCAALIALKTTYVPFALLALIALAAVFGWRWGARSVASFALIVLPWIALHAPHYLAGMRAGQRSSPGLFSGGMVALSGIHPLSFARLPYGASVASYTLLFAAIGVSPLLVCWAARGGDETILRRVRVLAAIGAAGMAHYALMLLTGPLQSVATAVRYTAPVAIGLAPAAFAIAASHAQNSRSGGKARAGVAALAAISLALFAPSLAERAAQAWTSGSTLAFSWLANNSEYLDYNRQILYGPVRQKVAAMQNLIPTGDTILAWTDVPFYLDYARNPIIDAEPAGLSTAWAQPPEARYLIWEYNGYATRPESDLIEQTRDEAALERRHGAKTLEFLARVRDWTARGQVLYDDGESRVVRLAPARLPE